jgi:hypothetical protein
MPMNDLDAACRCAFGWICEAHPDQPFPHADCTYEHGTGMQCDDPEWPVVAWASASGPRSFAVERSARERAAPSGTAGAALMDCGNVEARDRDCRHRCRCWNCWRHAGE